MADATSSGTEKMWGKHPFWGLGSSFDPEWLLTEEQKKLQSELIELCRVKMRPNAIKSDKTYEFPRDNLNALAEIGLLGLIVPKELGGRGENHVGTIMVLETIARYGCPSTALVYVMHLNSVATLLYRCHKNPTILDLLRRLDKDKLVGSQSYSDPASGGHFWFPMTSKCRWIDDDVFRILKYASWTTSAGFADFYTMLAVSPGEFKGDFSQVSTYLVFKDEVRASTDNWAALGMHGNQSGPMIVEAELTSDRIVGTMGDGASTNFEIVIPQFLINTSAVWNGVSLALMDIAKKHVTRKAHADVGLRICDYSTIQEYFGDCLARTNSSRLLMFSCTQMLDSVTDNRNYKIYEDPTVMPCAKVNPWFWQAKYMAASTVNDVADTMLHACGGTGYKEDLGLERIYRDAKAGWVMALSNEVLRVYLGKCALTGLDSLDFYEARTDVRVLNHELCKMTLDEKKALVIELQQDIEASDPKNAVKLSEYQDKDFDNPFNTNVPLFKEVVTSADGKTHAAALNPEEYVKVKLVQRTDVNEKMASFVFAFSDPQSYSGCLPGQYVKVRLHPEGKPIQERYFSPVSLPEDFGRIELILQFESQGILSQRFKNLKLGESIEMKGPCGGFEYTANTLKHLTLLASCGGVTPSLQLIRYIHSNEKDTTKVTLVYFSEKLEDILYKEELDSIAAKDDRFKFIYTLSEAPENWQGEEGFIDKVMLDRYVEKSKGPGHKVVICGGATMVSSCVHALRTLCHPSSSIFIYGQFGIEQIRAVYGRNVKLSGHTSEASV